METEVVITTAKVISLLRKAGKFDYEVEGGSHFILKCHSGGAGAWLIEIQL